MEALGPSSLYCYPSHCGVVMAMMDPRDAEADVRHEVVGLIAHVDAGKTTLAEALLLSAGVIRRKGRVDTGDAYLDFDPIERERGITVFSSGARLEYAGAAVTLLDAPGHVDFSAEAERTLMVLDIAVLVVAANDGVSGHTRTLWRLLERYRVPVVVFVNKCDLAVPERADLMAALRRDLSDACFDYERRGEPDVQEALAMCDEEALEKHILEGSLSEWTIASLIWERKAHPCLFGSALHGRGTDELLAALAGLAREHAFGSETAARIFKVSHDARGERLAWLKVTGGVLAAKSAVRVVRPDGQDIEEKIDQVRLFSGPRMNVVPEVAAGELACVTGLVRAGAGDAIGAEPCAPRPLLQPVLGFSVTCESGREHALLDALATLTDEDPLLEASFQEDAGEVTVRCMGPMQIEVVRELLESRFGIVATFGTPRVVYKETIAHTVRGVGHFEPLRHYAEVHLLLEPLERGAGMAYESRCSTDDLELRWQRLILTHCAEREHRGVLVGAGLTDVRIVLVAGRAHPKHTEGGDFRQATYRAIRQALMRAESLLLEPMYAAELEVPSDRLGRALSDLQRMNATFDSPEVTGEVARILARVPVSEIAGYAMEVQAYTSGRGHLFLEPAGYETAHDAERVIEEAAYDPEADLAHTPDSVFCSHGAGYTVKWHEVEAHAHVTP